MTNDQLRTNLILLRQNSRLNRVQFCKQLHPWLSPHTLKRWEYGQNKINLLAAEKLGILEKSK